MAWPPVVRLDGGDSTLLLDCSHAQPAILHFGAKLSVDAELTMLPALLQAPIPLGVLDVRPSIALTPTMANGYVGPPGLLGQWADGTGFAPVFAMVDLRHVSTDAVQLVSRDATQRLELCHDFRLDAMTGVLEMHATLRVLNDDQYWLGRLVAPVVGVDDRYCRIIGVSGRWAGEFQLSDQPLGVGAHVRENRRGRTSHDAFPGLVLLDAGAGENAGHALGFHLGASGNHFLHVERFGEGGVLAMFGELLLPGECRLSRGDGADSYTSPTLYAAASQSGLAGISSAFQQHVRAAILPAAVSAKPRPVHYNSWEAVYFNHDEAVLRDLAGRAAGLGVERFVLDDGWFGARRHDRAALGDWTVSADVYPAGLNPLAHHVRDLGMEFGLWVEPEMVNPDSDLYRAHPDWILSLPGAEPLTMRHQLVLDLTREEVGDYLFRALDALLRDVPISYLKWDMNRDLNQPGDAAGRPVVAAQMRALYALIDRLRGAHPHVEIESCASGGGRTNYEILRRTERIWTSDSNDALDRLAIQRGAGLFFPPEVMGSHIGPRACHITGRRLSIELRAAAALFGHMGLEMDLRELTDAESAAVASAIALHKRLRPLLHGGVPVRLPRLPHDERWGVMAEDGGQGLFAFALTGSLPTLLPGRYRFQGLDSAAAYHVRVVWQSRGLDTARFDRTGGRPVSGSVLMNVGVALPFMQPQSVILFHLERA